MVDKTKLLELRKKMNVKRPKFLRQDYHHRVKVQDDVWRAPKGGQSKMRQKKRGHRASVRVGYRGPAEVRGLHRSGAKFVYVNNLSDINKIHPAHEIAILSANLGARKRHEILKLAIEKKIPFANINAEKFVTDFELKLKAKKEVKAAKVETKAVKPEAKGETPKPAEKTEEIKTEVKAETQVKPAAKKKEAKK